MTTILQILALSLALLLALTTGALALAPEGAAAPLRQAKLATAVALPRIGLRPPHTQPYSDRPSHRDQTS